tara:strand:+ start:1762 stop:1998 length:237 start_codon:yes stop_codon:yes gene_type:complete
MVSFLDEAKEVWDNEVGFRFSTQYKDPYENTHVSEAELVRLGKSKRCGTEEEYIHTMQCGECRSIYETALSGGGEVRI